MIPRSFLIEIPDNFRKEPAKDKRERCTCRIVLDGREYRCGRPDHAGVHDAFKQHPGDGGWVRW